jgi:hypothetical protein
MKSKDGFVQAYNTQAAVDAEAQIIVAHDVTQNAGDCGQLIPMTDAIEINVGRMPEQSSADFPPLSSGGALVVQPWLRFHIPLIEPDARIARIRLSDKSSRLHPRHVVPKPAQAYEPEMPVFALPTQDHEIVGVGHDT